MVTDAHDRDAQGGGMRSGRPTPGVFPQSESLRPTVVGSRYAVSAGHPLVAGVMARVLDAGGTAVDAGVAGGLASNVVQVDMCNLGGVAPIVVRPAGSDEALSIAGLGRWGRRATLEAYRERYGDAMPLGAACAITPAAVAAWLTALERFGTWSLADVAAPAIELAREGFPLDAATTASLEVTGRGFSRWASSRAVLWPAGRPPRVGERLVQRELGELLEQLVAAAAGRGREDGIREAHRAFYEGEPAERIVRFVRDGGGWLEHEDLASFRSEVEPAVRRRFRDQVVFVNPTWCQGPALLQALAILEGLDLEALGHGTADYDHALLEATKLAFWDREAFYGDPAHVDVPLDWLLSDERAADLGRRIHRERALPYRPAYATTGSVRPDTTYLCCVDGRGEAFSAMPSDTVDGGPLVPGLGILVSPRGVQSRLDPAHPAAIGPGKRPRLTPAPAIALQPAADGDGATLAFGCPGGDVILQGMLQAFLNRTVFGLTPQQAVEAPRVATFSFPSSFYPYVEAPGMVTVEDRIREVVRRDLAARGHDVTVWPPFEFDAGAVSLALDLEPPGPAGRVLAAAADPRRTSYALAR